MPATFRYQWRKWIAEDIADGITLKYLPWPTLAGNGRIDHAADKAFRSEVLEFASRHHKPICDNVRLYLQPKNVPAIKARIDEAWQDPRIDGVILYEGPRITRMDVKTGQTRIVPLIREVVDEFVKK